MNSDCSLSSGDGRDAQELVDAALKYTRLRFMAKNRHECYSAETGSYRRCCAFDRSRRAVVLCVRRVMPVLHACRELQHVCDPPRLCQHHWTT